MREIATTLSDYILAATSGAAAVGMLAVSVRQFGPALFFSAFALATAVGGTWHGFFSAPGAQHQELVWWLSMLFAGLSSAGLAVTGVEFLGYGKRAILWSAVAVFTLAFGIYAWRDPRFVAGLVASVAGTLLCVAGLLRQWRLGNTRAASLVLFALALSILAALAQHARIALHPIHFDHNATYHVILLPALGCFYAGLRRIAF